MLLNLDSGLFCEWPVSEITFIFFLLAALQALIIFIDFPLEDINIAIENAGKLEVYKLEKNVSLLATLSGTGPMTGFLGTVVGMVMAFHEMAASGSNKIEMSVLAEGIYTAMMTTVVGLIVGIIAYVGYNHLVSITDKIVHMMEVNVVDFLDVLN